MKHADKKKLVKNPKIIMDTYVGIIFNHCPEVKWRDVTISNDYGCGENQTVILVLST